MLNLKKNIDVAETPSEASFNALKSADRIYLVGKASYEFQCWGYLLVSQLPRFDGVVVARKAEDEQALVSSQLKHEACLVEIVDLVKLADTKKIVLIDYSSNFVSLSWVDRLARHPNIKRCDWIQAHFELNLNILGAVLDNARMCYEGRHEKKQTESSQAGQADRLLYRWQHRANGSGFGRREQDDSGVLFSQAA